MIMMILTRLVISVIVESVGREKKTNVLLRPVWVHDERYVAFLKRLMRGQGGVPHKDTECRHSSKKRSEQCIQFVKTMYKDYKHFVA